MGEIAFTRAWEDDRLDLEVLDIKPGERTLCVAAAGDIALAYASAGAERVIAVDNNPAQLQLAALKIAAAGRLAPAAKYEWFEVGQVAHAEDGYRRDLRGGLDAAGAEFWDRRVGLFEGGCNQRVGAGRSFGLLGRVARWLAPSLPAAVEQAASPAEQVAFWNRRVRPRLFGPITHWLFEHTPALAALAPNGQELRRMRRAGYLHALEARVMGVLGETLVRHHPWWRPAFSGRPVDPGRGAAWLDADRAAAVATGAKRIELLQDDLTAALEKQPPHSLDVISVSNVPDWLAPFQARRLRRALVHALRPGGRALVRGVLADERSLAGEGLVRDPASDALPARDRTALYGRIDLLWRE